MIVRKTEGTFTTEDVDFLSQAAGQMAIAIENALAYREIFELKDKLAQEKLYLEEKIRSEMDLSRSWDQARRSSTFCSWSKRSRPPTLQSCCSAKPALGQELFARAIHDRSRRRERTLVKLNCAAIPTGLLESELFGHEKGAFTGAISQKIGRMELADQGSLYWTKSVICQPTSSRSYCALCKSANSSAWAARIPEESISGLSLRPTGTWRRWS